MRYQSNTYHLLFLGLITVFIAACAGGTSDTAPVTSDQGLPSHSTNNSSQADTGIDDSDVEPPDETTNNNTPDEPEGPGKLMIESSTVTFSDVRIGGETVETITLRNVGNGNLRIDRLSLLQLYGGADNAFVPGEKWISPLETLPPHTFRDIEIKYIPTSYSAAQGVLNIQSNDPDETITSIRLETVNAYADIEAPNSVRFGTVAPGEQVSELVAVYNRGLDPLDITEVSYAGHGKFHLEFQSATPVPVILNQHHYLAFHVVYSPEDSQVDRGTITIKSNDPDDSVLEIAVVGNGATPCISTGRSALDFHPQALNQEVSETLAVLNCSGIESLQLLNIELVDDGGGVFGLRNVPQTPVTLASRTSTSFEVTSKLTQNHNIAGFLRLTSDDPEQEELYIVLRAHRIPDL